ncbi:oxidoreductase [Phenylobacterium montanum]|uniref:NAD(P)-binding protein n=1 Tax=Phenylobacterium montanum TaxID=2823693 RepID=A0A975IW09_9CAUL|nr:NAD(P)-binding protein [Caulobacter sp. S6]QUD89373.1 NAD(P)-binding protein [Caulobacter sp. S6]
MPRDPRWDILFEPVKIGPVTAPNRFYQVPHASGMTNVLPQVRAAFREVKAEGGWGVVCTGAVSIHPSSDDSPLPAARLWDEHDVRAHALMTEAVHRHGSLAGVELWHGGAATMNRSSRIPPLSPSGVGWMSTHVGFMSNQRARAMNQDDIKAFLGWYRDAAIRAKRAGFDIVYVYAGMGYLLHEFLLPAYNRREDAYGGSVKNRTRLIREALETVKEAVGDTCGVALRISLDELRQRPGTELATEAHEVVAELGDLPDLWDVKLDSSPTDCGSSRFRPEGSHEPVIDFVKSLTSRPVVGVGRFTSPDAMVSQIRRGVLDLIGAARPSIADPFLPRKLDEGREDEIRECIGCNICISSWHDGVPVRCTQNPTIGEEWRRGWHPERYERAGSADRVLVVGAGPAGLDCALTLARRGYEVAIADKAHRAGGRILDEAELPGLNAWRRVLDYRLGALVKLPNAQLYLDSELGADEVLGFGAERVVIATGCDWVPAAYDARMETPGELFQGPGVFTPQDVFAGRPIQGPVAVFDYDNYYMGGCIAERLAAQGLDVTYVTPAGFASAWTIMNNEQPNVHMNLARLGVELITRRSVAAYMPGLLVTEDIFTRAQAELPCASLVVVGHRRPRSALYDALVARKGEWAEAGVRSVDRIGDAAAPGALVHAVYSGHLYARTLDAPAEALPYRIDNGLPAPAVAAE